MPLLELEPETHTYKLGGVEIPGCTHVLTAVGAAPTFWFLTEDELNFYRSRGQAVHKMIELSIKGTLDKRTIPKEIKPYLIGWERFMNDYDVKVFNWPIDPPRRPFTEIPLHHEVYRYGVTPDVVAYVKGNSTPSPIELKATSAHSPATEIQTAAQLLALENALGGSPGSLDKTPRYACRLLDVEPYYDPKVYTERGDRATWIGMLNTYNWRARHNLIRSNR